VVLIPSHMPVGVNALAGFAFYSLVEFSKILLPEKNDALSGAIA